MKTHHVIWIGPSRCSRSVLLSRRIVSSALVIGLLAGCGGGAAPTVAVHGKVTLKDGQPLTGGFLFLVPTRQDGWEASGTIQPDGTFRLESLGLDGAVPGEYKVRLAMSPPASARGARKKVPIPVPIDRKYLDENSSGLVVKVPSGGGPLTIRLE